MKKIIIKSARIGIVILLSSLTFMLFSINDAHANAFGYVHCDANNDGIMTKDDMLLPGVTVNINGISISYFQSAPTDAGGYFSIPLLDSPQTYNETLDPASIPNNAVILFPAEGQIPINVTDPTKDIGPGLWLLSYASCKPIVCGDNWVDANEECDDGNTVPGDGCRADCTTESCGDGILDPQEECDDGNIVSGDGCSSTCTIEQMGGQGCTPGYWKQTQHFDSWPSPYTPTTLFSTVFENAFPGKTLLQVLQTGGGGLDALGRHTVAALLNAASSDVNYDLSVTEVITLFNNVYPGTKAEYNGVKDTLAGYNEQGCPLD